jgi:hypothetical protein
MLTTRVESDTDFATQLYENTDISNCEAFADYMTFAGEYHYVNDLCLQLYSVTRHD